MSKTTRAHYTLEFKLEAVRLVKAGQSVAAVAATLNVPGQSISNWLKAEQEGKLGGAGAKPVTADRSASRRQLSSCKTGLQLSGQRIRLHNPGPLEGEKPREAHIEPGIAGLDASMPQRNKRLLTITYTTKLISAVKTLHQMIFCGRDCGTDVIDGPISTIQLRFSLGLPRIPLLR
jgi:transposase-like protein